MEVGAAESRRKYSVVLDLTCNSTWDAHFREWLRDGSFTNQISRFLLIFNFTNTSYENVPFFNPWKFGNGSL
jgi:hypothetical protein